MLVVHGADGAHRLPAAGKAPEEGVVWHAEFAWQEAPVAFGVAELHLGPGVMLELPAPSAEAGSDSRQGLWSRTSRPRRLVATQPSPGPQERLDSELRQMSDLISDLSAAVVRKQEQEQKEKEAIEARLREASEQVAAFRSEIERLQKALEQSERARSHAEAEAFVRVETLREELETARRDAQDSAEQARAAKAEAEAGLAAVSRIREAFGRER